MQRAPSLRRLRGTLCAARVEDTRMLARLRCPALPRNHGTKRSAPPPDAPRSSKLRAWNYLTHRQRAYHAAPPRAAAGCCGDHVAS